MYQPSTVVETQRPPALNKGLLWGAAIGVIVVSLLGWLLGGELGNFVTAGLQSWPFTVLAVLAYLGIDRMWARVLALLWLALLVAGIGMFGLSFGIIILSGANLAQPESLNLANFDAGRLLLMIALMLVSVLIACLAFVPSFRRAQARVLPIDPDSFVHTIALAAVISLTLLSFVPLIVLGEPPLLTLVSQLAGTGQDLTGGQDDAAMLRSTLYGLVWMVPGAILAVGYAVRRRLGEALTRLGFVWPTVGHIGIGVGVALLLVVGVSVLGLGIDWLWETMGWPRTDAEAFGELLAFAFSLIGAIVIGVTAGIGEELAVRGVLQPRLGILLSNLFFTALHAFQYNWDSLLVVFVVGLVFGLIRKRYNTSTSAIAHGVYNFTLIMLAVLQVPGFTE